MNLCIMYVVKSLLLQRTKEKKNNYYHLKRKKVWWIEMVGMLSMKQIHLAMS